MAYVADGFRPPCLPRRLVWIAAVRGGAIIPMVVLSCGEDWSLVELKVAAVATACRTTAMDIAPEEFVVETAPTERRP